MPQLRIKGATFAVERQEVGDDPRLAVNDIVDVDDVTAKRWKKNGIAVDASHAPFDNPTNPQQTVEELRRQVASLQLQILQRGQPPSQPGDTVSTTPANPFFAQDVPGVSASPDPAPNVHDLTEGRRELGDTDDPPDVDTDADAEDEGTPHRVRVGRRNAGRAR